MGFLRSKGRRTASGRALLINAHAFDPNVGGPEYASNRGITLHSKIRVRVTPDDGGAQFESDASAWGGNEEHLVRGHWTYVLYDPEQPGQCDIDGDRLVKEFGRVNGKKRRTSVPQWASDEWTKQSRDTRAEQGVSSTPILNVAQVAESAPGSDGMVAGLKDLAQLHDAGALSDAEYAEAKARLLAHG